MTTTTATPEEQVTTGASTPERIRPTWWYGWQLIRFRPGSYALLAILEILFFGVFPQITALIIRAIFDTLTGEATPPIGLWWLIALIVGTALARAGAIFGDVIVYFNFRYVLTALMRGNLFDHILSRPGARAVPGSPGEAISRFREDVDEVAFFMAESAIVLGFGFFAVVAIVVMLQINTAITLTAFIPLLIIAGVSQWVLGRVERYREASRKATGQVTGFIGEVFGAIQAIKVATAEPRIVEHFAALGDARRRTAVLDRVFSTVIDAIYHNISSIGAGVVLLLLANLVRRGGQAFSVGDLALYIYYLGYVTECMAVIGSKFAWYKQVGVSIRRMSELLHAAPSEQLVAHNPVYIHGDLPEVPVPSRTAADRLDRLTVTGLTYRYPDTGRGIEEVDLTLPAGSFTVITGRVGAGKTTLLRALLGLLPAKAGEIRWNGETVTRPAEFFVPPRSAYTAQVPLLFSESLRDNILMGLPEDLVDLPEALRLAVMEDDLAEMPNGLDTVLGAKGVRLSGGQRQRTAAARMFVREPELLVFDDLSSALDIETEHRLWDRVELLRARGSTCLVVSHRRPALHRADQVIVLQAGRVIATGRLDALLESCAEMQRLWRGEDGPSRGENGP